MHLIYIYKICIYIFREGYPARACLLRSICEASEYPLDHNGVLGGIIHVIFTYVTLIAYLKLYS